MPQLNDRLCVMCGRGEPRIGCDTCLRCAPVADEIDRRANTPAAAGPDDSPSAREIFWRNLKGAGRLTA